MQASPDRTGGPGPIARAREPVGFSLHLCTRNLPVTTTSSAGAVLPANADQYGTAAISHVMMPYHANPSGNVNGGVIMQLIDDAAFVIATRYARTNVVTASIERIDFHRPVHIGDLLTLKGSINMTHRSSMEIGVRVESEDMRTGVIRHIASAYLTFVALDGDGHPTPVPAYEPRDENSRRRNREALQRRQDRLRQQRRTT